MGRVRTSRRRTSKNKQYKKQHDTKRRRRDVDQIQDDLKKEVDTGKTVEFEYDEDLPGGGQFYCIHCARHFADQLTLNAHKRTKDHKRRCDLISDSIASDVEFEIVLLFNCVEIVY